MIEQERPLTRNIRPGQEPLDLNGYERAGGYQAARKAIRELTPQDVQKLVKDANLRGRGGAGFPTGMKWSFVPMGPDARRPKYLCVNADEMEPGTFKDRLLLEGDPHLLIEGVIISSYAIEADVAYIFLRWAYKLAAERLRKAIAEAYQAGYLGKNIFGSDHSLEVHVHVSAGRYICGEETGLLNAIEGRRATPRNKPPFPATSGLWGKPTNVNNVETLCCVPNIVNNGAEWFRKLSAQRTPQAESRTADGGTKLFGVSGRVKRPGLWELPMGTTAREIIEEHAGGMADGYKLRSVIPGGASTAFIVEEHLDAPLDYGTFPQKTGSRMGTGTMLVLDDRTCPVGLIHNMEAFFAHESCGWCTPCREGLPWVEKTLRAMEDGDGEPQDIPLLEMHSKLLGPGNTFCALAPGAVDPLGSGLKYFRDDFERHIREKRCPWR